jgi:hypothetical protein
MQQFAMDGTSTAPCITVVAAPSLATLGAFDAAHPPSHKSSEFWNDDTLTP